MLFGENVEERHQVVTWMQRLKRVFNIEFEISISDTAGKAAVSSM